MFNDGRSCRSSMAPCFRSRPLHAHELIGGLRCRMARLNKQLTTILLGFCLKLAVRCLAFRAMRKESPSSPDRTGSLGFPPIDLIISTVYRYI